jgi:hypothetical protein
MNKISKDWVSEKTEQLKMATVNYSSEEKEKIHFEYLNNLFSRLCEYGIDHDDTVIGKIESVINALPQKFEELMNDQYQLIFYELEHDVRKRFKLVPKNFYSKDFNPYSTAKLRGYVLGGIGVFLISKLFVKPMIVVAVGIPVMIAVTNLISYLLDKKAERENRVL